MFPPELPPVSNRALYVYRIFVKLFSFFIFGFCSIILAILVIPLMRCVLHPRTRFQKYGRRFISLALRFFVFIMHSLRGLDMEVENRESYRHLSSKIVVANHPSLLDVVMLFSLIPNADCIVNANLANNILRGIVRQLYILNSREFDDIINTCRESLQHGNCLIIFPEGTRTPRKGKVILKKGAARISLATGYNIVPVHIGGTDKYGLGKKDPIFSFNPRERYVYCIKRGEEINPEKFKDLPMPAAAKSITREMAAFLFPETGV